MKTHCLICLNARDAKLQMDEKIAELRNSNDFIYTVVHAAGFIETKTARYIFMTVRSINRGGADGRRFDSCELSGLLKSTEDIHLYRFAMHMKEYWDTYNGKRVVG